MPLQITASSYTGGLAAALTQSDTVYYGPRTRAELSRATVCLPWFSQSEIDAFLANPSGIVRDGQFWGKRLLASTRRGFVGRFVGPNDRWDKTSQSMVDRMELCAQMMRSTSSADVLMAMMVPRSLASEFLLNGNCDDFERAAPDLQFPNLEVGPQWLIPSEVVRRDVKLLQAVNAVTKFLSATVEFQALEQRYLGWGTSCPQSGDSNSAQMTLKQQAGVATDRPPLPRSENGVGLWG
jgi:hypothetical protein